MLCHHHNHGSNLMQQGGLMNWYVLVVSTPISSKFKNRILTSYSSLNIPLCPLSEILSMAMLILESKCMFKKKHDGIAMT